MTRSEIGKYNSTYSENKSIKWEVSQGSLLGPLLFLSYIKDIHTCSSFYFPLLFADDTNLFISGKNIELETIVNREVNRVQV